MCHAHDDSGDSHGWCDRAVVPGARRGTGRSQCPAPCASLQAPGWGGGCLRVPGGPSCADKRDHGGSSHWDVSHPCPLLVLGTAESRNCPMQLSLWVKSFINNVTLIIKRLKLGLWFADCPFHAVIIPHPYS